MFWLWTDISLYLQGNQGLFDNMKAMVQFFWKKGNIKSEKGKVREKQDQNGEKYTKNRKIHDFFEKGTHLGETIAARKDLFLTFLKMGSIWVRISKPKKIKNIELTAADLWHACC